MERKPEPPARRGSIFGSVWRGAKSTARAPFVAFPGRQIVENARLIAFLYGRIRLGRPPEARVFRAEDGSIDMAATSFTLGISADRLRARMAQRRRQTARLAYLSFGFGVVFFVLWLYRAWAWNFEGSRMLGAIQFIPFCAIFFLVAFKNAHTNWQLRTGTLGSANEYIHSAEPFWPS